jgi:hypothetical protein
MQEGRFFLPSRTLKLYRFSLADRVAEATEVNPKASAIESLP